MNRIGLSMLFVLASLSRASAQQTWRGCAAEGALCAVPYATTVRYGANGAYRFKTVNGAVLCSTQVFGDPVSNTKKSCSFAVKGPAAPVHTASADQGHRRE